MDATGGSALSPAAVGGRRSRRHHKLRLVKKKTVRKMLARQGLKMRGGEVNPSTGELVPAPPAGGRRRSHKRAHRRSRGRSLFGLRY